MRSECIKRNLRVSDCAKPNLSKHRSVIRKVADKRVSSSVKKRLINQHGGFLIPLLGAVLHTLANLLFRRRAN
jgi:hypothetical protein